MVGVNVNFTDYSKNFYMTGTEVLGHGTMGVNVTDGGNVEFTNSTISENGAGVYLTNAANPSTVGNISNCIFNGNIDGGDIYMDGGSELSVYDSTITGTGLAGSDGTHGINLTDINYVDIVRVDVLNIWSIGIGIYDVGQADIAQSILRSRWPVLFINSSGNVINTITDTESDGLIADNSASFICLGTLFNRYSNNGALCAPTCDCVQKVSTTFGLK